MALRNANQATVMGHAVAWLVSTQNKDGGWSTAPGAGRSDWTSGPATLALRVITSDDGDGGTGSNSQRAATQRSIERALAYMFDSRTEFYGSLARLLLFAYKGASGLDYSRGWPWTRDCYHWIEPTVYALLALKLPSRLNSGLYDEIIGRAEQFIIENECKGGGWNHGNMYCLKFYLPAFVVTTSEALLALQETPESVGVKSALDFLVRKEPTDFTAMEYAWSILALNAHGKSTDKLVNSLVSHQNADGSFGLNLMVTALATLAIETAVTNRNPLKYKTV